MERHTIMHQKSDQAGTSRRPWLVPIVLGLLVISLGLHIWTIATIANIRSLAKAQVAALSRQVGTVQDDIITVNVNVNRAVPINATIPVREQISVPISTTVELNESVRIAIENVEFDVPLNIDVPIRTTVPITVDETVNISTTVDLDLTTPLSIAIQDTSLASYLEELQQALLDLSEQL